MISKKELQEKIISCASELRSENPMSPSVTNAVTINFVANAQLAVGGSAAMCYLSDELITLGSLTDSIYVNLGTMLPLHADSIPETVKYYYEHGKKWTLDPVGIGSGKVRGNILQKVKAYPPSIVRGNASEILALCHLWGILDEEGDGRTRGVDATESVDSAKDAAVRLARFTRGAVSVSGEKDLITDGQAVIYSYGGSKYMPMVTGMGCSLGGVTAAYACTGDPLTAAVCAANVYNLAGKRAEAESRGPGSFYVHFIDQLYLASPKDIAENPFDLVSADEGKADGKE